MNSTTADTATLTATDLQRLLSGPRAKIAVQNTLHPETPPVLLYHSYPLDLLTRFSPVIQTLLSRRIAPGGRAAKPANILLYSPCPEALYTILTYLFSFAESGATTTVTTSSGFRLRLPPFRLVSADCIWTKYILMLSEARYLGIRAIENQLVNAIVRIMSKQVHSQDVENVYQFTSNEIEIGKEVRGWCAGSIALTTWEGRLLHRDKYDQLQEKYADFKEDLNHHIQAIRARGRDRRHSSQIMRDAVMGNVGGDNNDSEW